jgi:thymidylate synthase ThyX
MDIKAEIICDSISREGKRITTFKLRYPKFIHGEFMTHRTISRNASSSRAIPTAKYLEEVRSDELRAAPVFWGANQRGMQATTELSDEALVIAKETWCLAALDAASQAEILVRVGAHKQIVNRILEPFLHINVIATATEWDNFFGLRLHKDAQPEIRVLAHTMWEARLRSTPTMLTSGEWHLPFVECNDWDVIWPSAPDGMNPHGPELKVAIKVSVARCARVSYESFETGRRSTVEEDLALYEKLAAGLSDPSQPLHASPMEHQAMPDEWWAPERFLSPRWKNANQHGNFIGWRQYRKMLPGEACAPLPAEYQQ